MYSVIQYFTKLLYLFRVVEIRKQVRHLGSVQYRLLKTANPAVLPILQVLAQKMEKLITKQ